MVLNRFLARLEVPLSVPGLEEVGRTVRGLVATVALVTSLVGLITDGLLGAALVAVLTAAVRRGGTVVASSLVLDPGTNEALLAWPDTNGLLFSAPPLRGVFFLMSSVEPVEILARWAVVGGVVAATGERFAAAALTGGRTAGLLRLVPVERDEGVVGLVAGFFVTEVASLGAASFGTGL
jgi:hypothetical protein